MATYVITHEVDDVEHWLSSPKREEVFGPMGITLRTFGTQADQTRPRSSPRSPTWRRSRTS